LLVAFVPITSAFSAIIMYVVFVTMSFHGQQSFELAEKMSSLLPCNLSTSFPNRGINNRIANFWIISATSE